MRRTAAPLAASGEGACGSRSPRGRGRARRPLPLARERGSPERARGSGDPLRGSGGPPARVRVVAAGEGVELEPLDGPSVCLTMEPSGDRRRLLRATTSPASTSTTRMRPRYQRGA